MMATENHSAPMQATFRVEYMAGRGFVVVDPNGKHVSSFYKQKNPALTTRDGAQKAWDAKHKRIDRPCLSCGNTFKSEGIHNRLCDRCRGRSDGGSMSIAATSSGKVRRAAKA